MSWRVGSRFAGCLVALALAPACSKYNSPSSPSTPASSVLNLTGAWAGQAGTAGSGSALRVTWTATHTSQIASGPATVVKPATNVPANGTMTAVVNGAQTTLTFSAPAGSVAGFASCQVTGAGLVNATPTSISGSFTLVFTSCPAASGLEPPETAQLSLTKQ